MASTTAWDPKRSARRVSSSGSPTAAVFTATLSAPARSSCVRVVHAAHPAPHREGQEHRVRHPAHHVEGDGPRVGAGRDVEEDQLVGALGVVAQGALHGIAGVPQGDEAHALDHPAAVHVETGHEALGEHGQATAASASAKLKRRS